MVLVIPLEAGIESIRVELKSRTQGVDGRNDRRLPLEGVGVEIGVQDFCMAIQGDYLVGLYTSGVCKVAKEAGAGGGGQQRCVLK